MVEKRFEIRTILNNIPENLKTAVINYPGLAPFKAEICDINSEGMAFISIGVLDKKLEDGKEISVRFDRMNFDLKGKTIYSYPIVEARQRIGVLFKNKNDMIEYNKMLKDAGY